MLIYNTSLCQSAINNISFKHLNMRQVQGVCACEIIHPDPSR
jgi:hypothetical protein